MLHVDGRTGGLTEGPHDNLCNGILPEGMVLPSARRQRAVRRRHPARALPCPHDVMAPSTLHPVDGQAPEDLQPLVVIPEVPP
eukprot:198747-Chlamydomonas_euryale.AAC.1